MGLTDYFTEEEHREFLEKALQAKDHPLLPTIVKFFTKFGKAYNNYEMHGIEHIPKEGPGLVVMYHGLVPLDLWYALMHFYKETGRLGHGLGDNFVFRTPILSDLARAVGAVPGNPDTAKELLKAGELVGVCPGGVKEAISGTKNNYKVLWGKRRGFARLALEAKVPIIPGFTQNVEEMYRAPFADSKLFKKIYDATRLPLVPIMGMGALPFPVKLTTWMAEPIHPTDQDTEETLAAKTKKSMEKLIRKHQDKYANPISGIKDRLK